MSPIKGITDSNRLVFGGTIRTGIMVQTQNGKERPQNVEYFVLTDAPDVAKVYGDKPTELHILFPSDDLEQVCSQWLMSYTASKLRCKGNGEVASYKGEDSPQGITDEKGDYDTRKRVCTHKKCPDYIDKKCTEIMRLRFVVPRVSMFKVYQLPTTAVTAMEPIVQLLEMTKGVAGTLRQTVFVLRKVKKPFKIKDPKTGKDMNVENWTIELDHDASFTEKYGKEVMAQAQRLVSAGGLFTPKALTSTQFTALPVPSDDTPPPDLIPEEHLTNEGPDPIKIMLDDPKVQELFLKVSDKMKQPNTIGKQEATAAKYKNKEDLIVYLESKLV